MFVSCYPASDRLTLALSSIHAVLILAWMYPQSANNPQGCCLIAHMVPAQLFTTGTYTGWEGFHNIPQRWLTVIYMLRNTSIDMQAALAALCCTCALLVHDDIVWLGM